MLRCYFGSGAAERALLDLTVSEAQLLAVVAQRQVLEAMVCPTFINSCGQGELVGW